MTTKLAKKLAKNFICESCDYACCKQSDYEKHITTSKHKNTTNGDFIQPKTRQTFLCSCGKSYPHRASLFNHKKKCKLESGSLETDSLETDSLEDTLSVKTELKNLTFMVIDLMKSNSVLQQQLIEVCKNTSAIHINNNNINSHNNNKTFNLQFFLNEQCKDAMNISDFANSIDLQLSDLESVGELGYVEGITKIMIDKLNSMDIYKRPIHCSDAKRETLYVKDDNKWEKEGKNNPKLRYVIKTISFRNMKLAALWSDTYPESQDGESHLNDTYLKIIKESTGGHGEISVSEDKIIRRIAKEIVIDK
jgi:hypothetical protein